MRYSGAGGARTGEAVNCDLLHSTLQLRDSVFQVADLRSQFLRGNEQKIKLRFGGEIRIGGPVRPVAGIGNLTGRLLGVGLVGPHGLARCHGHERAECDQHGDESTH